MADRKTSQLPAATTANLHSDALVAVVDLLEASAANRNLKATILQLAAAIASRAPNGTAGAPSVSFASDPDTGVYRVGTNEVGIAAGGDRRLSVRDTAPFVRADIGGTLHEMWHASNMPYVESSWTPTWGFETSGSATVSANNGRYQRIGNWVHFVGRLSSSALSSPVGSVLINGLPFSAQNLTDGHIAVDVLGWSWGADMPNFRAYILPNQNIIRLVTGATNAGVTPVQATAMGTGSLQNNTVVSGSFRIN